MNLPLGDLASAEQRARELIAFADAYADAVLILRTASLFPAPGFTDLANDMERVASRMRATGEDVLRLAEEVRSLRRP